MSYKEEGWVMASHGSLRESRSPFSLLSRPYLSYPFPSLIPIFSSFLHFFSMYMKSHEHAHLQLVIFLIFFMPVTPLFPNLEFQISKHRGMWRKWAVWERFWPIRVTYTRCWSWKWRIAIPRSSSLQSRAGSSATLFSTRLLAILASSFNSSTPGSATPYIYIYIFIWSFKHPTQLRMIRVFPTKVKAPILIAFYRHICDCGWHSACGVN